MRAGPARHAPSPTCCSLSTCGARVGSPQSPHPPGVCRGRRAVGRTEGWFAPVVSSTGSRSAHSSHGAPSPHTCGAAKRHAAIAGPTFSLVRGRVAACSAALDSSGVAAPARVRSVVVRITADASLLSSTRGRVSLVIGFGIACISDISCCNAKVLATFLSTYRYGAVDAHGCRQAREASSAKTWWNCACSRAS